MKDVIILPTYNERENIGEIIPRIFKVIPDIHILVADDSSPDGTAEIVRGLQNKYSRISLISRPEKNGLGRAYINAFNHVLKDPEVRTIITMDADMSHQPKYLVEMIAKSYTHEVIVGSRYTRGGDTVGWEFWRKMLSFWANIYCRIITRIPVTDLTAGFHVINTKVLRKIDLAKIDMSGYAFQVELKYKLHKLGATFHEVPIVFVNRVGGESKMSGHIIHEAVFAPWKMIFQKHGNKSQ